MNNPQRLMLIRHGRAGGGLPDESRILTPLGRQEIRRIGHQIKETGWQVAQIVHSGYERTRETAIILAGILRPEYGPDIMKGVTPNADALSIRHELEDAQDLLVVSHLPFLDELAYEFINPEREDDFVHFMPGTAIGLQKEACWALAWRLTP